MTEPRNNTTTEVKDISYNHRAIEQNVELGTQSNTRLLKLDQELLRKSARSLGSTGFGQHERNEGLFGGRYRLRVSVAQSDFQIARSRRRNGRHRTHHRFRVGRTASAILLE